MQVEIKLPPRWNPEPYDKKRFKGDDGNVFMSTLGGLSDASDACESGARHRLQPFGSRPRIQNIRIAGRKACVVWPSKDQIPSASIQPEAMLAIPYPAPVRIKGDFYWVMEIHGDVDHIMAIASTVRFFSEVRIPPPDDSKFTPSGIGSDDLILDLDDDGIPEVAVRYVTGGHSMPQTATLKILRYSAASGWAEAFQEEIDGVQPNFLNIWQVVTCADGKQGLLNTISKEGTQNVSTWYVLASVNGKIVKLEPPPERLETLKANGYDGRLAQAVFSNDNLLVEEFVKRKNPRLNSQPPNLVLKYRFTGSAIKFVSVEKH
jgi:hypothetical protein